MSELKKIRTHRAKPFNREECLIADRLYAEYISRPQHRNRLSKCLKASLRAAANSVARHGLPPNYNQRLGYRTAKRNRARKLAIALYGSPTAKSSLDAM